MVLFDNMLVFLITVSYCHDRHTYIYNIQFISDYTGTRLFQTWTNVSAVHAPMVAHVRIKSTDSPARVFLAMMV